MKNFFRLIRWPNLLMMLLLQYLLRYCMAAPILEMQNLGLLLTDLEFFILSFSSILIAAGGYIINDIEDIHIDRINKPDRQIITQSISETSAFNIYLMLTTAGVLGAFYLSAIKGYQYVGMVYALGSGLLYFYSTSYKCIPFLGNFIISFLAAGFVYLVVMNEPFARKDEAVMLMTGAFMFFSFTTTLLREFIKDIEDVEGDLSCDCQTMANVLGIKTAKWIAWVLSLILLGTIILSQVITQQWESLFPFLYIVFFVDFPLLYLSVILFKATQKEDFRRAGNWLKLAMFTATISLVVFYYSFK